MLGNWNWLLDKVSELGQLAIRDHLCCEDEHYSCFGGSHCFCGAREHNIRVREATRDILEELGWTGTADDLPKAPDA